MVTILRIAVILMILTGLALSQTCPPLLKEEGCEVCFKKPTNHPSTVTVDHCSKCSVGRLWHFEENPANRKEVLLKCIDVAVEENLKSKCLYMVSKLPRATIAKGEKLLVECKMCQQSIPDANGQLCLDIPVGKTNFEAGCKSYSVFNGIINCESK